MDILPQLIANSLIVGATYALLAMSFSLIYSVSRFFNIAHGVTAAIGGYTVLYLAKLHGVPLAAAIPLGIATAALVGWLLEFFIYRALRARGASSAVTLIASLGAFTALQAVLALVFTSQFQTLSNLVTIRTFTIGGGIFTSVQLVMFASSVAVCLGLWLLLFYTKFGKAVRAVSDDAEVAKIVGINTDKIIGRVVAIGSGIAGLAGILIGFDTGLQPTMGFILLLKGIIGTIAGGIGSISGSFLGAYLLGFVENFGIWQISGEWKDAIAFTLLIVFLLFRPQGIFGKK